MKVSSLNSLDLEGFSKLFANTFEHHPEAAGYVYAQRPFSNRMEVVQYFSSYIDKISLEDKKQILQNHPMLGSKKTMTAESTVEQKSAGLNNLETSEAQLLAEWNEKYFTKFGFPYIICVLETTKDSILSDIQQRYNNSIDTEVLRAIEEVKKIGKHRILNILE